MLSAFAVYNSGSAPTINSKKRRLPQRALPKKKKKTPATSKSKTGISKLENDNLTIKPSKSSANNNTEYEVEQSSSDDTNGIETNNSSRVGHNVEPKLQLDVPVPVVVKKLKRSKKSAKKQKVPVIVNELESDIFRKPLDLLNYLLAPVPLSEFCNTYWEIKPLHIARNQSDYFRNLFSSKHIDAMLRDNLLYYTKNVDVVTYENGERQTHNPEGRAIPANVWDYYSNGCSVRVMNPQTYNKKIRDLLSTLQEYFGTMVGVNVYLTPPGSQGFAPHYDDIEAFVMQLEGHKNWKLYAPRNEAEVLPRYSSKNLPRDELGEPLKELTLQAGDILYFPRGFIHEASTDSDSHSLHITVSVYQNTAYIDLLEKLLPQALKTASESDVNFRKGLPLNYLKHVGIVNSDRRTLEKKEILNTVKDLIYILADYVSVDTAADQMGRKFMYEALPPNLSSNEMTRSCKEDGDRLENGVVKNIGSFNPDTMVRLARYHSQRLVVEENIVKIYYCTENAFVYHGEEEQYVELDDVLIDTVKTLQNNYPHYISIEHLPCNDEIKKIQAISDLWEKGLIITKDPLDIEDE